MIDLPLQTITHSLSVNLKTRSVQLEVYEKLKKFANQEGHSEKEVDIVLSAGSGRSGCITLRPEPFLPWGVQENMLEPLVIPNTIF